MLNTGAFAGKTVFVTGASRGIGKAIALKFAKDGANVVVAAKTVDPHPKLEGTIGQTAEEVNKLGGKGLAIQLDIRDEVAVEKAIGETVSKFGGIDLLVNNASAIFLAPLEETAPKKLRLMNSINIDGTALVSSFAIPHLVKSSNGHIINLSPPTIMNPVYFSSHPAYSCSKYYMSLIAYGMAAQLKGQVGVNCLWPKTAIWTAAMNMLGGTEARDGSRKPEIMADAAYAIATRDKSFTANFCIDEELLRQSGIQDFDQYAMKPGAKLLPDFFLPDHILKEFDPDVVEVFLNQISGTPSKKSSSGPAHSGAVASVFANASSVITEDMKADINATLHFVVADSSWTMAIKKDQQLEIKNEAPEKADVTLITDEATFIKMAKGETKPTSAFMGGKLKIKGSMGLALKVEKLFVKLKAKL